MEVGKVWLRRSVALVCAAAVLAGCVEASQPASTTSSTSTTLPEPPAELLEGVREEAEWALLAVQSEIARDDGAENVDDTHLAGAALEAAKASTAAVTFLYGELFHDPRYFDSPPGYGGAFIESYGELYSNDALPIRDGRFILDGGLLLKPSFPLAGAYYSFVVEMGDDGHLKISDFIVDGYPWKDEAWWLSDLLVNPADVDVYVTLEDGTRIDGVGEVVAGWFEAPAEYELEDGTEVDGQSSFHLLLDLSDEKLRVGDGYGERHPLTGWANWGLTEARWDFTKTDPPLTVYVYTPVLDREFVSRRAVTQLPVTYDGQPAGLWVEIPERDEVTDICVESPGLCYID